MNSICLPITELQASIVVQKNITINVIINGIENVDEHVPQTLQVHVFHTYRLCLFSTLFTEIFWNKQLQV
ncbi:hypothetical protein EG68_12607 [Paragonimus skrjabini miyazakii]|uniref:Uncharacterized protein n=1 Tax=Paragonimus skrjabini miyazakii TaxID=59628 RepID=A0A8S9YFH2_9TREM|nr:hypothetical protein EG68_12607 [Paragonimus skrjabini miyazakii]